VIEAYEAIRWLLGKEPGGKGSVALACPWRCGYRFRMQFIVPAQPKLRMSPPVGDPWIHEVKLNAVRQVTAKKRYARALAAATDWCRTHRHLSIPEQHAELVMKIRGHYAYYGISGNFRRHSWYTQKVARIWQKWLSRRGSLLPWDRFTGLLKCHPLPAARIVHRYTAGSESSPVKNRMLEIGTSGSVGEAGNILTYSAMLVVGLARQKSLRKLPCPIACHKASQSCPPLSFASPWTCVPVRG